MRWILTFLAVLLLPTANLADPSQASFAGSLGLNGTAGVIEVVNAQGPTPSRRDMKYWVAMDSTRGAQLIVRVQRMEFDDGSFCQEDDCVLQWIEGHDVDPGERLLIMAEKAITSLDLFVSVDQGFERFATLDGPFVDCRRDRVARQGYADGDWHAPTIAIAPFPTDPDDLTVDCVR